ncbi:MAG: hypothetical protein GAS50_11920 [Desulfobacterales bacterium]|jgi:hypothetical protein|nr:hypothetical protein [Desulfobacterales bacterium]
MQDFTLTTYKELLQELLANGYSFQTLQDFIQQPIEKAIIIRHDVDRLPGNSLKMARMENSENVNASYYFRIVKESYDDINERRAIGLTFLEYSLLAQKTEVGPRSFPLTSLSELSEELREIVLYILLRPPVSDILSLSTYTPSIVEAIPIISLQPVAIAAA